MMKRMLKKFYGLYVLGVMFMLPVAGFGQQAAAGGQAATLKTAISAVLGIMFLIAFPWGVITIWHGAQMKKQGNPDAYNSIIAGIWIAGGALIVGAIFAAMGLSGATATPTF